MYFGEQISILYSFYGNDCLLKSLYIWEILGYGSVIEKSASNFCITLAFHYICQKKNNMHTIQICLGSSCYSRRNNTHLGVIRKYIAEHGLEAEIAFSGHLCENLCSEGPILRIDEKVYKEVNLSSLYRILEELKSKDDVTSNP